MLPLLNKGHHLYCDNFYTSVPLFETLFVNQTPACGTARSNRQGMPKALIGKKHSSGQSSFMEKDDLLAVKFTDRKDVYFLTTIHDDSCKTNVLRRATATLDKPTAVFEYNTFMEGVDLSDQLFQPYKATRKTMTWYKKLSVYLFQHAIVNAFVLYIQSPHHIHQCRNVIIFSTSCTISSAIWCSIPTAPLMKASRSVL